MTEGDDSTGSIGGLPLRVPKSFDMWRRSFRPIVTVAVKTHQAGNEAVVSQFELSAL